MTQRNQAEYLISRIDFPDDQKLKSLERILGEAQNGPPHGEADGSINEQAYGALRDYIDGLRQAQRSAKIFKETLT